MVPRFGDLSDLSEDASAVRAGVGRDIVVVTVTVIVGGDLVRRRNIERMRYDEYREQSMQIGSGIVESGCRMFALRPKRSGTRCSGRGVKAVLAL